VTDLEKAKILLRDGNYGKCVLYRDGIFHTSNGRGITPMIEFIRAGLNLRGFSAADTVAGRAAALLFAFAGVSEVYADVMSEGGVEVFERHEIKYTYGILTQRIKNRAGDGVCPMEGAVENIHEPKEAFEVLFRNLKLVSDAPDSL
jgi:hypothetical protein